MSGAEPATGDIATAVPLVAHLTDFVDAKLAV